MKHDKIDTESIQKRVRTMNIDRIGILDVVAKSVCKKIGIKPDFEFGVIYAAIDAAQRGLNTAIFGYDEKIREALKIFEEINKNFKYIICESKSDRDEKIEISS